MRAHASMWDHIRIYVFSNEWLGLGRILLLYLVVINIVQYCNYYTSLKRQKQVWNWAELNPVTTKPMFLISLPLWPRPNLANSSLMGPKLCKYKECVFINGTKFLCFSKTLLIINQLVFNFCWGYHISSTT